MSSQEDEDDDEEDERLNYMKRQLLKNSASSNYRSMNNQTRLGIRKQPTNLYGDDDDDEEGENEMPQNFDEEDRDYDEDEDDDDDEDNDLCDFKYASPVVLGKKFASTGFLFHRYGGYLAPIEENVEDEYVSDVSDSASKSSSRSSLNTGCVTQLASTVLPLSPSSLHQHPHQHHPQVQDQFVSIKGSTSCFNLLESLSKPTPITTTTTANNDKLVNNINNNAFECSISQISQNDNHLNDNSNSYNNSLVEEDICSVSSSAISHTNNNNNDNIVQLICKGDFFCSFTFKLFICQ